DDLRARAVAARRDGWAPDDQWLEPGLVAVAVPVPGPDGTPACTVNVLSFTSRHATAADLADAVLPTVAETVRRMADVLRTAPEPAATDDAPDVRQVGTGPLVVESLVRGLNVLAAFGESRPLLSIADAARVTGLPRATVRRALITLEYLGYVTQSHGRYRPRAAVLSLGCPVLSRLTLAQIATPHLEALSARVGDSVSLAVPHGDTEIMYRARAATAERLTSVDIHVGTRLPAYATALGRVLLAARPDTNDPLLERVRADGYAVVDEELEAGLRAIAVPVLGHDDTTLAAVNVAMHAERGAARERVAEILPDLRSAADAIHRDLVAVGTFHRLTMM
ncbi:MAG TPA: IclR family transcriptional regulator C-terminal domain-containing protein, partial [Pseudonocardiaceae bacterium]